MTAVIGRCHSWVLGETTLAKRRTPQYERLAVD